MPGRRPALLPLRGAPAGTWGGCTSASLGVNSPGGWLCSGEVMCEWGQAWPSSWGSGTWGVVLVEKAQPGPYGFLGSQGLVDRGGPASGQGQAGSDLRLVSLAEEVMLAEEDKNAEEKSPLDGRSLLLAPPTQRASLVPHGQRHVCTLACWGRMLSARPGSCTASHVQRPGRAFLERAPAVVSSCPWRAVP